MRKSNLICFGWVLGWWALGCAAAWASSEAQATPSRAAYNHPVNLLAAGVLHKFSRGVVNVTTAGLELPRAFLGHASDSSAASYIIRPIKGIGRVIQRTAVGVWDVATCPVPPYDKPLMEPEYALNFGDISQVDDQPLRDIEKQEPLPIRSAPY